MIPKQNIVKGVSLRFFNRGTPIFFLAFFLFVFLSLTAEVASAAFDGPSELPRATIDTTMPVINGNSVTVKASGGTYGTLQAALDAAATWDPNLNHLITVDAGMVFNSTHYMRARPAGSGWVVIKSSGAIAAEGNRQTSGTGTFTIQSTLAGNYAGTVLMPETSGIAHHYRWIGLRVVDSGDNSSWQWITLGEDGAALHIIFDRVYLEGHEVPQRPVQGIKLNGQNVAVINSTIKGIISQMPGSNRDTQAIIFFQGSGPYLIDNNYLEAAGENAMGGGAGTNDAANNTSLVSNSASATTQASSGTGPVGFWKIDEFSGTTASDSSGNNTGTLVNGPVWTTRKIGNTLSFNGTNNYVTIADSSSLSPQEFTISAWVKLNTVNGTVIGKGYDTGSNKSYALMINTNGTIKLELFTTGAYPYWTTTNPAVTAGSWYHIAVTYSNKDTTYSDDGVWYINGSPVPVTYAPNSHTGGVINYSTMPVDIARNNAYATPTGYINGLVDDVRIYNRALSASEILNIYNAAGGTPPPSDTTAPSAPANLSATAVSSSQINLSWTASTDNVGVTGYRVERCQGSGCTNFVQIATPTTNSYSDTSLSASTVYTYRVRANDAAGNLSLFSNSASATTGGVVLGNCPAANPNDSTADDAALQACLDRGGTTTLDPGSPGYIIATGLNINIDNVILTSTGAPTRARLLAAPGLAAPILHASHRNGVQISFIEFDGNRPNRTGISTCRGYRIFGTNVHLNNSTFVFNDNRSTRTMCGSALDSNGTGFEVARNLIDDNGHGREAVDSPEPWSDGITIAKCVGGYVHDNIITDSTDIAIVDGGGANCRIQNNTIRQVNRHAFGGIALHYFNSGQGDHTGTVVSGNSITGSGLLSFGLTLGMHPWDVSTLTTGGTVSGNTVSGAIANIAVDGVTGLTVTGNNISSPAGTPQCGGADANYTAAHFSASTLDTGYLARIYDGCIP